MERVKCTLPRWIYKISQSVQTAWLSAFTWGHVNLTVMCSRWLTLNMRSQPELVQTVRLCGHRLFDSEISLRTSTKSWPKSVAEWSAKCSGFISSSSAGREGRFSRGFCRTFALFFSSPSLLPTCLRQRTPIGCACHTWNIPLLFYDRTIGAVSSSFLLHTLLLTACRKFR